jgi:hypothetical protein
MSLNRCEQRIYDYWERHRDERQFWQEKVRSIAARTVDGHAAALRLESDLWSYYLERGAVAEPFREAVSREGARRTSMRNLAELILRLWAPRSPKHEPKKFNDSDL